jgi:type IV pilus assembly protein PilP
LSRLATIALLALTACGESVPVNAPPPALPKAPPKAAAAAPASPEDQYYYNPAGKRDPFQGFLAKAGEQAELPADAPPLQRYDVEKFTLKGVIWNTESPRALLVDPEGLGHVVRIGNYVGRNWGKVTSIAEDGVIVTEEYQTLDGELVVNPVAVRFAQGDKK